MGDLRDGKGLYDWVTGFKTTTAIVTQGELLTSVYAKAKVPVNVSESAFCKHMTDLAEDWASIVGNSRDEPGGYYIAFLNTLPDTPETSKVAQFRMWLATTT